jgi:uncharacterized Ntn-hydrolase superfamily protein
MTFSIAARCARTGMFGVAVTSSSPAVAARCAYARAGVGAATSQNITDPSLGPKALDLLALGASAPQAIEILRGSSPHMEFRQVLLVDAAGRAAIHSGDQVLGLWAEAHDADVACGGNLLASADVPSAMAAAFTASSGDLGDRLLVAMQAGVAAGGEAGPIHSAGLRLVREVSWPIADLRVDWTEDCPIAALDALWRLYKPQMEDYVTRATNPGNAPRYGVPGDL